MGGRARHCVSSSAGDASHCRRGRDILPERTDSLIADCGRALDALLDRLPPRRRLVVALSGGVDSRWLLHAHDRMGGDKFHLKQESLAQALGLRRATVSSACSDLMEAGAISYLRGKLTVTNRSVLHERSCACYDRVKNAELA